MLFGLFRISLIVYRYTIYDKRYTNYLYVMLGKLTGWDDTIVALATAPGIGALGVIRLSGPKAVDIVNVLFASKDLSKQPSHTLHVGSLKNGDEVLDEV